MGWLLFGLGVLAFIAGVVWAIRTAPTCSCNRPDCGGGCPPARAPDPYLPRCFGSFPGPQQQAENDCAHCRARGLCFGR